MYVLNTFPCCRYNPENIETLEQYVQFQVCKREGLSMQPPSYTEGGGGGGGGVAIIRGLTHFTHFSLQSLHLKTSFLLKE